MKNPHPASQVAALPKVNQSPSRSPNATKKHPLIVNMIQPSRINRSSDAFSGIRSFGIVRSCHCTCQYDERERTVRWRREEGSVDSRPDRTAIHRLGGSETAEVAAFVATHPDDDSMVGRDDRIRTTGRRQPAVAVGHVGDGVRPVAHRFVRRNARTHPGRTAAPTARSAAAATAFWIRARTATTATPRTVTAAAIPV